MKNYKLKILFISVFLQFVLFVSLVYCQDTLPTKNYKFVWGLNSSIDELATNTTSLSNLAFDQMNNIIRNSNSKWVNNPVSRCLNIGIQGTVGTWMFITLPHELAHTVRGTEGGINDLSVKLEAKFMGGYYTINTSPAESSPTARLMTTSAGTEHSTLIAYNLTKEMYSGSYISPYSFIILFGAKYVDGYSYYLRTKEFNNNPDKWLSNQKENYSYLTISPLKFDPLSYTITLAEKYGYYDSWLPKNEKWIFEPANLEDYINEFTDDQFDRMRKTQLLALADPALLFSAYATIDYIISGKERTKAIMIPLFNKSLKIMPGIRANMGTWGYENYFDIHAMYKNQIPIRAYYRQGGNLQEEVKGVGFQIENISLTPKLHSLYEFDYWTIGSGFHVSAAFDYQINKLHLHSKLGYKSYGSLIGKPYQNGLYANLGFGFDINQS